METQASKACVTAASGAGDADAEISVSGSRPIHAEPTVREIKSSGIRRRSSQLWWQAYEGESVWLDAKLFNLGGKSAAGGMAVVFRGHRDEVGNEESSVAIKVICPEFAHDHLLQQCFVREFELLQLLKSAGCRFPQPHAFGVIDGLVAIVMDWIPGKSFFEIGQSAIRMGRILDPELVLELGCRCAHELAALHSLAGGVVHRDVSLSNIMLRPCGRVTMIDLGVAAVGPHQEMRDKWAVVGKYRYMSPEQARGRRPDPRCDVYSLSVCLWELLTLRAYNPCVGRASQMHWARMPRLQDPRAYNPSISPELAACLLKGLAPDRSKRYGSMDEYARGLASTTQRREAGTEVERFAAWLEQESSGEP